MMGRVLCLSQKAVNGSKFGGTSIGTGIMVPNGGGDLDVEIGRNSSRSCAMTAVGQIR